MPNWTTNAILMHASDRDKLINEDGNIDFNLLLPMPDSLHQTSGSITSAALDYYRGNLGYDDIREHIHHLDEKEAESVIAGEDSHGRYLRDDVDDFRYVTMYIEGRKYVIESAGQFRELGRIYAENQEQYGSATWYDWACTHWGTKWNASYTHIEELGEYLLVTFDTAWNAPSPYLIDEMHKACAKPFIYEAVDEDNSDVVYEPGEYEYFEPEDAVLFVAEEDDGYVYVAPRTDWTEEQAREAFSSRDFG